MNFVIPSIYRKYRGLSIVETLIILVIGSVLTILLLDGVFLSARSAERIEQSALRVSNQHLNMSVLRSVIHSTVIDYSDKASAFTGDQSGFSGLSLKSFIGKGLDIPTPYAIAFKSENGVIRLVYESQGRSMEMMRWLNANIQIQYMGVDGVWSEYWPRQQDRGKYYQPNPSLIRFDIDSSTGKQAVLIALWSNISPEFRARDYLGNGNVK